MSDERENIRLLRFRIQEALNKVAEECGLLLSLGNISYDKYGFTTKLSATFKNVEKVVIELNPEYAKYIGKTLYHNGRQLTVVGYVKSRPKNPWLLRDTKTGEQFKSSATILSLIKD